MGARDRLPVAIQAQIEVDEGYYAYSRYALYRGSSQGAIASDAAAIPDIAAQIVAVIDARGLPDDLSPELVTITRASLAGIACLVLADDAAAAIPIGEAALPARLLLVEAGIRLEPDALARLVAAMEATGAVAAYCDHDHWERVFSDEPGAPIIMRDPCFQPMFDPIWFRRAQVRPPCMIVATSGAGATMTWSEMFARRLSLTGPYAHIPLVLANRWSGAVLAGDPAPRFEPSIDDDISKTVIQVIIQTRDAPDMLERCVASLLRTARHPDRLDVLIVDNRSVLPQTAALLTQLCAQGIARVMPHDEPFNWARANNLATAQGQAPYLLFLNNDVEMDTMGWDDALCDGLAQDGTGVMGALLLYPDHRIQHAGVVLGMRTGGAVHEGVGQPTEGGGPTGRWLYPRLASAVTGAWLATSRALFEAVEGFEERLPVAYNDIDFCLRCRAAGQLVLQASQIVAVHRESATRGSIMSLVEHARDQADWSWLRTRWGEALDHDPAFNPNWARIGQPFDAMRAPSPQELSRWITASAQENPWAVPPPSSQSFESDQSA
jgi:GT2 family glycosyltransferase